MLRTLLACRAVPLERGAHGVEQLAFVDGLGEKIHRAGLHCLDAGGDAAVAADEDHRTLIGRLGEHTLQVQA